jgi:hypothetical protein
MLIGRLRGCLNTNKVFFETLAASLLAVMAIIVSLAEIRQYDRQNQFANQLTIKSNEIADSQNKLMAKQTELIELQSQIALQELVPQFVITAKQIPDETGYAVDDSIFVQNLGGIVREIDCYHAVFLEVEFYHQDPKKGEPKKKWMPLVGYYVASVPNPVGKGEVWVLMGNRNNERAVNLDRDFGKLAEKHGLIGFAKVYRYLRLKYRDMLGNQQTDYYYVPMIFGAYKITAQEGESIFNTHRLAKWIEFTTLTASDLIEFVQDK